MERGLSKNQIVEIMAMSPHGDFSQYVPTFTQACQQDPEFAAHFISYVAKKSQVRDINTALPVISLAVPQFQDGELVDNSLAHLAKLNPPELLAALRFAKLGQYTVKVQVPNPKGKGKPVTQYITKTDARVRAGVGSANHRKTVTKLVTRYLRAREDSAEWFESTALNFRRQLINLYFQSQTQPSDYAKTILYDKVRPQDSSLEVVATLERMEPRQAAASIVQYRIPFLSLFPILKKKARGPILLSAIIDQMTPTELQTNLNSLAKLGVNDYPETRAALELALDKLAKSKKTTLKTTRAIESSGISDKSKERLRDVQEKQIAASSNIQGDWGLLVDRSGSMSVALEAALHLAAYLAKATKGKVHVCFFDTDVRYLDATGKSYEQLKHETRLISPGGSTSIGCGLHYLASRKLDVDGIAIVSDGEENASPRFADVYGPYCAALGKEIPVYFYKTSGSGSDSLRSTMQMARHTMDMFDLRGGFDYYSLPNIAQSMRTNRYSIHDEIMESKLLTVDKVIKPNRKEEHANA